MPCLATPWINLVGGLADFQVAIGRRGLAPYDVGGSGQRLTARTQRLGAGRADQILFRFGNGQGRPDRCTQGGAKCRHQDRLLLEETRNALSCILRHRQGPLLGVAGYRTCLILAVVQLAAPDLDSRLKLVLGRCVSVGRGLARLVDGPCHALAEGAGGLVHRA